MKINAKTKHILISFSIISTLGFAALTNAAWYTGWFSSDDKSQKSNIADSSDKLTKSNINPEQKNLDKLLEVMRVDEQISDQIESVMLVVREPFFKATQLVTQSIPDGAHINSIITENYSEFKSNIVKSINYKKIYNEIYSKNYTNSEILELIKIFSTDVGQKFIKDNMEINTKILLELQPLVTNYIVDELPKVNKRIMGDIVDSDYFDKIIDKFKNEFKQELKEMIK